MTATETAVARASTVSTDAEISSDAEKHTGQSGSSVGAPPAADGPDPGGLVTLSGEVVAMTWKTWVVIFVSFPSFPCLDCSGTDDQAGQILSSTFGLSFWPVPTTGALQGRLSARWGDPVSAGWYGACFYCSRIS